VGLFVLPLEKRENVEREAGSYFFLFQLGGGWQGQCLPCGGDRHIHTPLVVNAARCGRSLKSTLSQKCRKELPSKEITREVQSIESDAS
jgi:hypothetical protein